MRNVVLALSLLLTVGSPLGMTLAAEPGSLFQPAGYSDPYVTPASGYSQGPLVETPDGAGYGDECFETKSWFAPPEYGCYFQGDALYLTRFDQPEQTVAVNLAEGSRPVLNSDNARLTNLWRLGTLLTVGRQFDQVSAFEVTYFGLNSWHATSGVTGAGNLAIPSPLANVTQDFVFADQIIIDYSSTINNAEGNYRQTLEGLTLLMGFRYFNLDESFRISSTVGTSTSDYKISAINHLIGGQVGAGMTERWGRLTVEALGKFGVFANLATQRTDLYDFNNTFVRRDTGDNSTATSVLGEAIAGASFQVFDWLAIRGSYRFIWVHNVALAPNQLDFSNTPASSHFVDANDQLFLQGVSLGAELRW
ncbi:MAG: hypothetical protein ACT4QC_15085 [Planctomycetaceae bacterium]